MLIENKSIAIIGGGPGGLTLARLLQMKGADVKVYERDLHKDVRVQGATLDLHSDSGLKALAHAGLMDAFRTYYRPGADKLRIVNLDAEILFDDHTEKPLADFDNPYFRPEIDRGPLRKLLLESLQDNTIVWNSKFLTMQAKGNGWLIQFENGSSAYADIVIGSDGANSKIRPFLTDIKPFYSGVTVIEGGILEGDKKCPRIDAILQGGKIFAMGNEQTLIVSSKADNEISFYTGWKAPESWAQQCILNFNNKTDVLNWFQQTYTSWNPVWQELFEQENTKFMLRPQYCMPLNQDWEAQANLTLLGDAAHLMPPFAGEGVNMAMLDALELSECLLDIQYKDIKTAISTYETNMRKRAAAAAKMSLEQTESLHSKDAIQNMIAMFGEAPE